MSIVKRAKLTGKVVISETLLECPKCGRRDVGKPKKCPSCGVMMEVTNTSDQK